MQVEVRFSFRMEVLQDSDKLYLTSIRRNHLYLCNDGHTNLLNHAFPPRLFKKYNKLLNMEIKCSQVEETKLELLRIAQKLSTSFMQKNQPKMASDFLRSYSIPLKNPQRLMNARMKRPATVDRIHLITVMAG